MMSGNDYTDEARGFWAERIDDVEEDVLSVGMRLRRIAAISQQRLDDIVKAHGFKLFGDYQIMATVRRSPTVLQPNELAQQLRLTRAGVTGRLDRLEADGLIKREPHADDRRRLTIRLTALGRRRVDAAFRSVQTSDREFLATLTDIEVRNLSDLLRRVVGPHDNPTITKATTP